MPRSNTITLTPSDFRGVTLVGGGPGDADLISVAGIKALLAADVVVTDRLAPRELLADLDPSIEVIDVAKVPRSRFTAQEEINRLLVERAHVGKNVVRLKGGDGYVFGRGFEELLALQKAGVPVRVIPGLSSSISVPALAGIPVTHRGVVHEFTVVSGHLPPDHPGSLIDWAQADPAHPRLRWEGSVWARFRSQSPSPGRWRPHASRTASPQVTGSFGLLNAGDRKGSRLRSASGTSSR